MKEFFQKDEKTLDKIKDVWYDIKVARLKRTKKLNLMSWVQKNFQKEVKNYLKKVLDKQKSMW